VRLAVRIIGVALLATGWIAASSSTRTVDPFEPVAVQEAPSAGVRITYPEDRIPVLALPDGQTRAVHSLLNIERPMQFGDYVWNDDGIAAGPIWVRVDLARQTLSVFRSGHEIGSAVILFGADDKPTPSGVFPVLAKARRHRSSLYDAEMPFMLRLTGDGVAIHASDVRQGSATHGCIGIPLAFAQRLFGQIRVGDQVAIIAT
jgi:hypothetical protein